MALANHVISFYLYLFKFNFPLSILIFVTSNYMINSKLMTMVTCEHLLRYISLHWMSGLFFGSSQHICVDLVLPWKPVKNGCFKLGGSGCVSPFVHCLFCLDVVTFDGAWFLSSFFSAGQHCISDTQPTITALFIKDECLPILNHHW